MIQSLLIFLRDRFLPVMMLLIIIVGILGGMLWLLARTYLWNTSGLTLLADDTFVTAEIRIASRVLYYDFDLYGFKYPVHIILPWSHQVSCHGECVFEGLPNWEAKIALKTSDGDSLKTTVLITPLTRGTIDLRTKIRIQESKTNAPVPNQINSPWAPSRGIMSRNIRQWLWLFLDNKTLNVYDAALWQNILIAQKNSFVSSYDASQSPEILSVVSIVRGIQEGEYYLLMTPNRLGVTEVWIYDRYGRKKTEKVSESVVNTMKIVWWDTETKLVIGSNERTFPEKLFWFNSDEKWLLFDGKKVFEILNN